MQDMEEVAADEYPTISGSLILMIMLSLILVNHNGLQRQFQIDYGVRQ